MEYINFLAGTLCNISKIIWDLNGTLKNLAQKFLCNILILNKPRMFLGNNQFILSLQVAVFALVAVSFAQDYDYDEAPRPRPKPGPALRPAPPRIQPGYSGPASSAPKPTPVPILKQINK